MGTIKSTNVVVCELWVRWLIERVRIKPDGWLDGYIEEYVPGWLFLQMGRSLWPNPQDVWLYKSEHVNWSDLKWSSVALCNMLRAEPHNGYVVDRMSFKNWRWITAYDYREWRVLPKWMHHSIENVHDPNVSAWQVLRPGQVQPGLRAEWNCWVPLVHLEAKIQMLDDAADEALNP